MPVKCYTCSKTSRGKMPTATINGQERSYCADCYWKLQKEYQQKKTCEGCAYFAKDRCKKTKAILPAVTIGYETFFTGAEKCGSFSEDKEIVVEEAKKLMTQGKYEEAACEYEKLGMTEQAEKARKKITHTFADVKTSLKTLTESGQTITYHCCHCGMPIKVGAKAPEIQKTCPRCRGDLEIIDMAKLISQHSS